MVRSRLAGLGTAALLIGAVVVAFAHPTLPWNRMLHFNLSAGQFGQMDLGSYVELNGVKVGQVESVRYQGGHSLVGISVKSRYGSMLHRDASAVIRPHSLLGPKYVEIHPGHSGVLADGSTITRTTTSTDLDQVLNALQPDVRKNLQVTFIELGTAAQGRGQDLNAAYQALGHSVSDLHNVTSTLRSQDPALAGLIVHSETLNRDVQNAPIGAQIADTNHVLSGLAQVDSALAGSIDHTAGFAQELNTIMSGNSQNLALVLVKAPGTVANLEAFLVPAGKLVGGVTPGLPPLMTAIMESKSFLSGSDANGHYVKVIALGGPCSAGAVPGVGCAGAYNGYGNPTLPASLGGAAAAPGSRGITDQQLIGFVLGS